ncbi:MAG: hypothetical protein AAGK22_13335 [Acidobacteriota bacterium]
MSAEEVLAAKTSTNSYRPYGTLWMGLILAVYPNACYGGLKSQLAFGSIGDIVLRLGATACAALAMACFFRPQLAQRLPEANACLVLLFGWGVLAPAQDVPSAQVFLMTCFFCFCARGAVRRTRERLGAVLPHT